MYNTLKQRLDRLASRADTLTAEQSPAFVEDIKNVQQQMATFIATSADKEQLISLAASLEHLMTCLKNTKQLTSEQLQQLNRQNTAHNSYKNDSY